jgi:hypothetical protein
MKLINKIILLVIVSLLIYSVGLKYISQHEFIHYKINQRYNISSEIEINYFQLNGITTITNKDFMDKCTGTCKLEHSLNDIIGYSLSLFIYFIIIMFIIIIICFKYKGYNNGKR